MSSIRETIHLMGRQARAAAYRLAESLGGYRIGRSIRIDAADLRRYLASVKREGVR